MRGGKEGSWLRAWEMKKEHGSDGCPNRALMVAGRKRRVEEWGEEAGCQGVRNNILFQNK